MTLWNDQFLLTGLNKSPRCHNSASRPNTLWHPNYEAKATNRYDKEFALQKLSAFAFIFDAKKNFPTFQAHSTRKQS